MPAELEEAPTRETINPALKALFDVEPPTEYPVTTTDDKGKDTPAAKMPLEKKEEPPAPAPTPTPEPAPAPEKKPEDTLKIRLAPDFAAEEKKAEAPAEPSAELAELNQAIKDAPTEKARIDLTKFRDKLEVLTKEVTTLRARPAAPPENPETKTLLETVTKERDELLAKVERTDLWESPKFQKEHVVPRQKSFDKLQGIVKEGGADPVALQRAMSMSAGKGRIEALDEIRENIGSEMLKGQFDRLVEDIDSRTVEINEKLRNAKVTAEENRRNETVQSHEQKMHQQKQLEGLLGSAIAELTDNIGLEVLKKTGKPEFKWWDDQVDEIHAIAREVYLDATPEKAAMASVLAASAGPLRLVLQATQKALKAVEQENRELKGADPTLSADKKPAAVSTDGGTIDDITARLQAGHYRK